MYIYKPWTFFKAFCLRFFDACYLLNIMSLRATERSVAIQRVIIFWIASSLNSSQRHEASNPLTHIILSSITFSRYFRKSGSVFTKSGTGCGFGFSFM